ncbi:hypothetical protein [Streptomyces sp. NPDC059631]|uniref:hypothetical protein n=1 Tax=unclassified Streptomyces TaxID=2593676 RepID=UPI00367C8302
MSVEDTWHLAVSTPIRRMEAVVELRRRVCVLTGTAYGAGAEVPVPLNDVVQGGDRLTWTQAVARPMRLDLAFDVTVDGRTLRGACGAGRLPAPEVTGERRSTSERRA